MKKRIISLMLTAASAISGVTVMANDNIKVMLDGEELQFAVKPQIINDRTMVPVREVFEALGYVITWEPETKTVDAVNDETMTALSMQVGNNHMNFRDKTGEDYTYFLDSPPVIKEDKTLIPLRAISETSGCAVEWSAEDKTVHIYKDDKDGVMKAKWNEALSKIKNDNYYFMLDYFEDAIEVFPENERLEYALYGIESDNDVMKFFSAYLLTTLPESHNNNEIISKLSNPDSYEELVEDAYKFASAVLSGGEYESDDEYLYKIIDGVKIWKIGCNYVGQESLWIRKTNGEIVTTGMITGRSIYEYIKIPGKDALLVTYGGKRTCDLGVVNYAHGNLKETLFYDVVQSEASRILSERYGREIDFYLRNNEIIIDSWIDSNTCNFTCYVNDWGCETKGTLNLNTGMGFHSVIDNLEVEVIDQEYFDLHFD